MATENADLENRTRETRTVYLGITTLFTLGSIASAIGANYETDHRIMLYGMSAYSAMLSAGTIYWWYKASRPQSL